jgi:starch phosphorylase
MTPLALRLARSRNGVSKLHGEVARQMWRPVFPGPAEVPIIHVTNGAHLPTFISEPMRDLFVRHLDGRWLADPAEPSSWEGILAIPNEELWAARCEARRRLIEFVRAKAGEDSLQRGEQLEYVRRIEHALGPDALTIGFARRLATYKRIYLLPHDPERARRIFTGTAQLIIAGKAHPSDTPGKESLQRFYEFEHADAEIAGRVVIVEDYDISVARHLVSGCDLWVNLPRKPMEASGTSGMKATFNGALQLSVLDGWWAEAYDGSNGWAITGGGDAEEAPEAVDARDAGAFYDLLEHEVIPLFNDRDPAGVPQEWCDRIKRALVTLGPAFTATRMLDDYIARVYQG